MPVFYRYEYSKSFVKKGAKYLIKETLIEGAQTSFPIS